MKIQIYSHKTPEDALMSAKLGVDFVGVATGERGRLPLEVSYARCRDIFSAVSNDYHVSKVALTVSDDLDEIVETVAQVKPDVIHLSGDIDSMPVGKVAKLKGIISSTKIMQAIPVIDESTIDLSLRYQAFCDYIILDTDIKSFTGIGATGSTHDWSISSKIVESVNIPVVLAGGLSSQNVAEAIRIVKPWCVDSFTHTNIFDSRAKDPEKIRSFVESATNCYE
ncbi:MAG TPA: N-(5'-phosphoribosyl)anthranilate isomerase [Chloroflexi bacterium]|nr:N-(5'-phosphoribosyl)anthranilate isomerase [Chloroflexota bacterium]|tara:strand:- start:418 stop:1089 length:672 start_codon:yes stop_codon:yes gene_type:complete